MEQPPFDFQQIEFRKDPVPDLVKALPGTCTAAVVSQGKLVSRDSAIFEILPKLNPYVQQQQTAVDSMKVTPALQFPHLIDLPRNPNEEHVAIPDDRPKRLDSPLERQLHLAKIGERCGKLMLE